VNDDTFLVQRLVAGDLDGVRAELAGSSHEDSTISLVTAALVAAEPGPLLVRAACLALATRDRQLVAIATAHLEGDSDLLDVLVRDHLVDHPDSLLAAWIATQHTVRHRTDHQE